MHAMNLSPVRIQTVGAVKRNRTPTFAAISKEQADQAKTVYYHSDLLNLKISIPQEKSSMTVSPVKGSGLCILIQGGWAWPLEDLDLEPQLTPEEYQEVYSA